MAAEDKGDEREFNKLKSKLKDKTAQITTVAAYQKTKNNGTTSKDEATIKKMERSKPKERVEQAKLDAPNPLLNPLWLQNKKLEWELEYLKNQKTESEIIKSTQ